MSNECSNCKATIEDGAKFCKNCGTPIMTEIVCNNCNTTNSHGSKFCKGCGTPLLVSGQETKKGDKNEKVVLGNSFFITLRDIYYEKILKRMELVNEATDPHSAMRVMDGSVFKREYTITIHNCFDHLISATKEYLPAKIINDIKTKRDNFLKEETVVLFDSLADLDEKARIVINKVPNSTAEDFANGFIKGLTLGLIGKEIDTGKYLTNWQTVYEQVAEEIDRLWNKLCDTLDEIANEASIVFDISDDIWEKHERENKNPIETIIENNLAFEGSGFDFYSNIPGNKKAGAKQSYVSLGNNEEIICLHDSTVFGGAKEGVCLTNYGIYWKFFGDEGKFITYLDIKDIQMEESSLFIHGFQVESCPCVNQLKNTLEEIVDLCKPVSKFYELHKQYVENQGKNFKQAVVILKEMLALMEEVSDIEISACKNLLGWDKALIYYNLACEHSLLNQKEQAINSFEKAIEFGWSNYQHAKKDSDLDNIRNEKNFITTMDKIR